MERVFSLPLRAALSEDEHQQYLAEAKAKEEEERRRREEEEDARMAEARRKLIAEETARIEQLMAELSARPADTDADKMAVALQRAALEEQTRVLDEFKGRETSLVGEIDALKTKLLPPPPAAPTSQAA